ncbi:MAG: hypothetical protein JST54_34205 [Deltaproteobacteria bacterium]|nr:hypothetical protein [Deltaproteobacteria bacterium]
MRRLATVLALVAGCTSPDGPAPTTAQLRGVLEAPADAQPGDAFVFLYDAANPPLPTGNGHPASLSAVPQPRGFDGSPPNADYLFAAVDPGKYLVRGIVDARHVFDPYVDVLAQPFADDADLGPQPIELQAGDAKRSDLAGGLITAQDPPMFTVDAPQNGVSLQANTTNITLMHVKIDPLPFGRSTAFLYGTADADHDGKLDDLNGDGVPDPYPEVLLQRIPDPNDGPEFKWPDGGNLTIVLPSASIQLDPNVVLVDGGLTPVTGMYVVIPPTAVVAEGLDATGKPKTRRLPSLPVGQYAITIIQANGQYWQVPNGLGPGGLFAANHGGPYDSQVARISVVPAP